MAANSYNPAQSGMGIGQSGLGDPNVIIKRKNRWTFEVASLAGSSCKFTIPAHFCKIAARPNITIEDTQIDFLNDRTWIPGKATWETIQVTYIDVGGNLGSPSIDAVRGIYKWLGAVYDFTGKNGRRQSSKRSGYSGRATLRLYDGCGTTMETWTLEDAWPSAIDFGDLDQSSSDTVDIQLTLRYSKVNVQFSCPVTDFGCDCEGC